MKGEIQLKKFTFKGGIHPNDSKWRTNCIPIKELKVPETMIFPMSQHIGAPATPTVQKGDRVLMYQKIGEASGGFSANIYSSVSGEVTDVKTMKMASGMNCLCVIVKNDFLDEKEEVKVPESDSKLSDIVFNAGIVGMGGAGFPTHIKLSIPEGKKAEYIIVNGSECEPYITSDHRVLLERGEAVIGGLSITIAKLGAEKGFIAIEKNKPDAIENMQKLAKGFDNIEVIPLEAKYPQGSEKQLIQAVTGREVISGKLPIDSGVVVLNVDTAFEINKAVTTGIPLIKRIVTVAGPLVKEPANFEVRIGTPIKTLIEAAGGLSGEAGKVIQGGPMMGTALFSTDLPVIKNCGAVLFFGDDDVEKSKSLPCIRCGRCVDACPMGLLPLQFGNLAESENYGTCENYHIFDCMECGACTYVCPSKRQLVQYIRLSKQKIKEGGKK